MIIYQKPRPTLFNCSPANTPPSPCVFAFIVSLEYEPDCVGCAGNIGRQEGAYIDAANFNVTARGGATAFVHQCRLVAIKDSELITTSSTMLYVKREELNR